MDFILICKLLRKFPVKYSSSALQYVSVNLSPISGLWYINRVIHNIVNAKAEQVGFFQV